MLNPWRKYWGFSEENMVGWKSCCCDLQKSPFRNVPFLEVMKPQLKAWSDSEKKTKCSVVRASVFFPSGCNHHSHYSLHCSSCSSKCCRYLYLDITTIFWRMGSISFLLGQCRNLIMRTEQSNIRGHYKIILFVFCLTLNRNWIDHQGDDYDRPTDSALV